MSGVMDLFLVARRCEEVRVERITDDGNEGSSRDESARCKAGARCRWLGGGREGGRVEERESGVGGRAVQCGRGVKRHEREESKSHGA